MSSHHHPPEKDGAISHENQPQVVVRAGKTYVCSACGTLVEIPADCVDQFVLIDQGTPPKEDATKEQTPPPSQANHSAAAEVRGKQTPSAKAEHGSTHSIKRNKAPARPRSRNRPPHKILAHTIIDGLRVPSSQKLDRAFAWVSFQLKVVDRQHSEIRQLKKLLKQQRTASPRPRPRPQAKARAAPPCAMATATEPTRTHAEKEIATAPTKKTAKDRAPP